jgi:hypothetical protein
MAILSTYCLLRGLPSPQLSRCIIKSSKLIAKIDAKSAPTICQDALPAIYEHPIMQACWSDLIRYLLVIASLVYIDTRSGSVPQKASHSSPKGLVHHHLGAARGFPEAGVT